MIRSSYSRLLLLFSVFLIALCGHVLADEESYTFGGTGFIDYVRDYFGQDDASEVPVPDVAVIGESEEASSGVALMSLSPEDIENGSLFLSMDTVFGGRDFVSVSGIYSSDSLNSTATSSSWLVLDNDNVVDNIYISYPESNDAMFDSGEVFKFSLSDVLSWWDVYSSSSGNTTNYNLDLSAVILNIYAVDALGNETVLPLEDLVFSNSDSSRLYFSGTTEVLSSDVYGLHFELNYSLSEATDILYTVAVGENNDKRVHHHIGFYNSVLTMEPVDQTTGLLSSIIDWLSGIWEGITSLPGKIVDGVKDLMISLFVPDDEFFEKTFEKFDDFLSEKLGFLYTSFSYILDLFNNLVSYWDSSNSVQETITFPEVSIPLPEDVEFVFGGWEVDIVPDGFEDIVEVLKFFVNMICTIFMIKTSWRYFEKLLGTPSSSVDGR